MCLPCDGGVAHKEVWSLIKSIDKNETRYSKGAVQCVQAYLILAGGGGFLVGGLNRLGILVVVEKCDPMYYEQTR